MSKLVLFRFINPTDNLCPHVYVCCRVIIIMVKRPPWRSGWRHIATARENKQNDLCAQRSLRSAWATVKSDHSLRCLHEKSLATHWAHRLIWVFAGRNSHFGCVVVLRLIWFLTAPIRREDKRILHICCSWTRKFHPRTRIGLIRRKLGPAIYVFRVNVIINLTRKLIDRFNCPVKMT